MDNPKIYSPWQINTYIKNILENDSKINNISISGEISNITYHQSGHLYFTIKDEKSSLRGICFKNNLDTSQKFKLGDHIVVVGSVQGYVPTGSYSFEAKSIKLHGVGTLNEQYENLKKELSKAGLFDQEHKKDIPTKAENIGIVTSQTGAVLFDILQTLKRRQSIASVVIVPTKVQGEGTSKEIINSLKIADKKKFDVIILARGGSSIEDLWAFNDKQLAQTIFEMETPIVCGIGHEPDTTIVDYVVDKSCSTPTAAAEAVTVDMREIKVNLDYRFDEMNNWIKWQLDLKENKINQIINREIFTKPWAKYEINLREIENIKNITTKNFDHLIFKYENKLVNQLQILNLRNPTKILEKGYSVLKINDKIIKSINDIQIGDDVVVNLSDGRAKAKVFEKE